MKAFVIYYEPWDLKLELPKSEIIAAEDLGKAKVFFRKYWDARIVKTVAL